METPVASLVKVNESKLFAAMVAMVAAGLPACGAERANPSADDRASIVEATEETAHGPQLHLLAPLSTSYATTQRPLFQWGNHGRVTLEICRDRACVIPIAQFDTNAASARPDAPLPPGTVFWRITRGASGNGPTSPVWQVNIPARESGKVGSWGAMPDYNGDGLGDIAVGVKIAPGQVRVFPGNVNGVSPTPAQILIGGVGFGDELGPAGDLDGDGFGDLAVWSSGPPQSVTVYRGGPAGLHDPVTFTAPTADSFSQMRVVSAGDVNGDGYGDLIVGGQVAALHLGGPYGVSATPAQQLSSVPSGATYPSDARSPIAGGDFNGDGYPDAVIMGSNSGLLYYGDGHTLVAQTTVVPYQFGALAGDYNGDGLNDYAAYEIDAGALTGPPAYFDSQAGAYAYTGVGDINGDGFSDVLYWISDLWGVPEAERVQFGGTTPCDQTPCYRATPLYVPGRIYDGYPLAAVVGGGVGDVNGDGYADIAYGSPGAGELYLFLGASVGPSPYPSLTITAEQGFGFGLGRLE